MKKRKDLKIGNMLVSDIIQDIAPIPKQPSNINELFADMFDNPRAYINEGNIDIQMQAEKRKRLKPGSWAVKYRTIRGEKFSFKQHPYQKAMINDMHPKQVICKAAQLGISEIMLTKVFWFGDYSIGGPSAKIIYTFPTFNDMLTYSAARIPPIIQESRIIHEGDFGYDEFAISEEEIPPYISTMMEVDSAKMKRIRDTFLFLKGTMGDNSAISIDSDWNIHDEVNFSNQGILNKFKSRIGASKLAWEYNFSTPTIPEYGVSKMYNNSDQLCWFVTCPHCNHSYEMDFEKNVYKLPSQLASKQGRKYMYRCHYCGKEITDATRIKGEFKALSPHEKSLRGYHLTKMVNPRISADDLIASKEGYRRKADFYNFDLGMPYSEKTTALTKEILEPLKTTLGFEYDMRGFANPDDYAVMGVDQGDTLWVEISVKDAVTGKSKVIYVEKVDYTDYDDEDPFQRLPELMERYNVWVCVIDALPNKNSSRWFKNQYIDDNRVYMAYYTRSKDGDINYNDKDGVVNIDRTETFKYTFNRIYNGDIAIPSGADIMEVWEEHMTHLKKETVEDEETGDVSEMFVKTGPDHLNHAHLYNEVARTILEEKLANDKSTLSTGMASRVNPHWLLRKGFARRHDMQRPSERIADYNRFGGVTTVPSHLRKGR